MKKEIIELINKGVENLPFEQKVDFINEIVSCFEDSRIKSKSTSGNGSMNWV